MEQFQELDNYRQQFYNPRHVAELPEYPIVFGLSSLQVDDDTDTEDEQLPHIPESLLHSSFEDECIDEELSADVQNKCDCRRDCMKQYSLDTISSHIYNMREMEKDTKEAYIMGALDTIETSDKRCKSGKRIRERHTYTFKGHQVCKGTFMLVYDINNAVLKNIKSHMRIHGNVPRVHGNKGRRPKHALSFADAERIVKFIVQYAHDHGEPQPAAPRGRADTAPIYLPACTTKQSMHTVYAEGCMATAVLTVKYTAFTLIWRQCCSHIQIATPETDVCGKCEVLRKRVNDARTDNDKIRTNQEYTDHVLATKKEFEVYKSYVQASLAELCGVEPPIPPTTPCSSDVAHAHYTFDFSQNVQLPHHARQMGPMYFLTPKKVHIFGVRDDGIPRQYNFVIDESQTPGLDGKSIHGPDAIISMLDFALHQYSHGEKKVTLHADNASGQNKNRFVLAYLCWRTMVGLNTEIKYLMQVPGHARCLIDAGFGHIKKLYRRVDCETLADIERVVNQSAKSNTAVMYGGTWEWRWWKPFLTPSFKALRGIRAIQHFRFTADHPGAVFVKKDADSDEQCIQLCQDINIPRERPPTVPAAGLSRERQAYLATQVGPYLREKNRCITCPPAHEE